MVLKGEVYFLQCKIGAYLDRGNNIFKNKSCSIGQLHSNPSMYLYCCAVLYAHILGEISFMVSLIINLIPEPYLSHITDLVLMGDAFL